MEVTKIQLQRALDHALQEGYFRVVTGKTEVRFGSVNWCEMVKEEFFKALKKIK